MATPRRTKYIDQAVIAALRDHAILESAIVAYEFSMRVMDNRTFGYRERDWRPDETLRRSLWQKRSEAASRALMFGNLSTNEELKKKAFMAATDFIIRENSTIMQYLTVENVVPSRWLADVQTEFREEINAAVREKLGVDPDADLTKLYGTVEEEDELLDGPAPEHG